MNNEPDWSLSSHRYQSPLLFPGGAWELLGPSPTRTFSRLVSICKGGVGGLGEHLEKTWGVGREKRGHQLGEVGKGSWGTEGC